MPAEGWAVCAGRHGAGAAVTSCHQPAPVGHFSLGGSGGKRLIQMARAPKANKASLPRAGRARLGQQDMAPGHQPRQLGSAFPTHPRRGRRDG